ncbi:MAG: thymidine kinase [Flavobacteriia bacterium]|nr:thymidine kinase [Flavobacteriia bacterium]
MYLEYFPTEVRQHGWIEVICGSMFSGKTEELIRRLKRAEFANQKIILFKPTIDNRYAESAVVSHKGTALEAIVLQKPEDVFQRIKGERIVAFDEAQFFDNSLIKVCNDLANRGIRVILAGLDMDYLGTPFGPMPELMCIAEYVTKVHAICLSCGNLAYVSNRLVENKEQVLVGAVEKYQPLCRTCYNKVAK